MPHPVSPRPTLLPLIALGALLAAAPGSLSAREREAPPLKPAQELRIERSTLLRPLPEAEVVLPRIEAFFLSDGSVTVRGRGTAKAGAAPAGFDYALDLHKGTYTTRLLRPEQIGEREPLTGATGFNRTGGKPGEPELKVSPGNWQGRVRVQTKDPAFIVLTETTAQVSWSVAANGTVTWTSYSDGCWAANPSALGTHWYNSSCSLGAAYYNSNRACNANTGSYYNYDFVDPNAGTFVTDSDWLCGRNDAIFDYNWSHSDSGEGALLIYGSVLTN